MLVTENLDNAINPNTIVEELPDYFVYKQDGKVISIWRKCNDNDDCISFEYAAGNTMHLFIVINAANNSIKLAQFAIHNKIHQEFNLNTGSLYPLSDFEIKEINLKY